MLTIKAEVQKDKQRSDGSYNVKIRFTYERKVRRLSSSLFVTTKDLTKSLAFKDGTNVKREIDDLVRYYQDKCAHLRLESKNYSLDEIIDCLKDERERNRPVDFIRFAREWISHAEIKGVKNYNCALNALIRYVNKEALSVDEITSSFLDGFMRFLNHEREARVQVLSDRGKRVPSNRSISLYMSGIRHLFNEAKRFYNDYDRNIIVITNSPFENFKVPKQQVSRKRAITPELLRRIWKLPYKRTAKGYESNCRYNLAKDCFILSFCLIGMNSVDLFNASTVIENTIVYYRTKTKERRDDQAKMMVNIPMLIMPIVDKYRDPSGRRLFNFHLSYANAATFNKAINIGLKEIGAELGVDDLEYYAARHSWATIALNRVGIDKYTVHAALNHVDESMKVTDIYIERDFVNENKANTKVVEYVFG